MFILIDFLVVLLITIYYLLFRLTMQIIGKPVGIILTALSLFVLAELAVLTLTGEVPVFGLLQKYFYIQQGKTLDYSIYLYRRSRDFAFSITGTTSAIIFVTIKYLIKNNYRQVRTF